MNLELSVKLFTNWSIITKYNYSIIARNYNYFVNYYEIFVKKLLKNRNFRPTGEDFDFNENLIVDNKIVNIKFEKANLYINGNKSNSFEKNCNSNSSNYCSQGQFDEMLDIYIYNDLLLLNWHGGYGNGFIEIYNKEGNLLKIINSDEFKYLNEFYNIDISDNTLVFTAYQARYDDYKASNPLYALSFSYIKISDNIEMYVCSDNDVPTTSLEYDDIASNSDVVVWGKYKIIYENENITVKPTYEYTVKEYYKIAKEGYHLNMCYIKYNG